MPRNARRPRGCAESLEGRRLLAGDAGSLIYNVNATTDSLGPGQFVSAGSIGYFVGQGYGGVGREVWRTDGTAAGTYRVKDVRPGPGYSEITSLATVGNVLYFVADAGEDGRELWRSDGTDAGTVRVVDLYATSKPRDPSTLTAVGDTLYFTAGDETSATTPQLWRLRDASGPSGGAPEVVPVPPTPYGSTVPSNLIAYGDGLFFSANYALYRVAGPTEPATQFSGTGAPYNPRSPVRFGGQVYFVASAGSGSYNACVWRTDGTAAGTVRVALPAFGATGYSSVTQLTPSGDLLYFLARDSNFESPYQLWRTDGTDAGTSTVSDANGWLTSSTPLFAVGRRSVIYPGRTAETGAEPWVTDGAVGTSRLLKEFAPGSADGWDPSGFLPVAGGRLLGTTSAKVGRPELWGTDGTPAGTALVREVDEAGGYLLPVGTLGGRFLFTGGFAFGQGDLYASDGTAAGTVRIGSADAGSGSSMRLSPSDGFGPPVMLPAGNGVAYFTAHDGVHGQELWRANPPGAAVAAEMVADLSPGGTGSDPVNLTLGPDKSVYFSATESGVLNQRGLYRVRPGGIPQRIAPDASNPTQLTAYGAALYFVARDWRSVSYLHRYDPASGAVTRVGPAGGQPVVSPTKLTVVGPYLYFGADTEESAGRNPTGNEPWRTDGTPAGTIMLREIIANSIFGSNPYGFTAVGSTVYFAANDNTHGFELWKTDGTQTGTVLAADLTPGAASTTFGQTYAFGGALYYGGDKSLVRYSEAGGVPATKVVAFVRDAREFASPGDGTFYFIGTDVRTKLTAAYRTDGSSGSAVRLTGPGTADPTFVPTALRAAGGRVYLAGRTGAGVNPDATELWEVGPAATAATKVRTLAPEVAGSLWLGGFYATGRYALSSDDQYLYFPAYAPDTGVEPYRMPLPSTLSPVIAVSTTIDDGTAQRSQVRKLTLKFNAPVTLAANALTLARHNTGGSGANDGSAPADASAALAAPTTPDGGITWVYTFAAGAFTEANGSLKDGVYTMTVNRAGVLLSGGGTLAVAPDPVTFHRKFGDQDGNKGVNNADYVRFRAAFGSTAAGGGAYNGIYDFDGNGTINNLDHVQFRSRFGTIFTY